jgi:hypothetical protein
MTRFDPMRVSAPLDLETPIDWTDPQVIRAELIRAQVELIHAIGKHRAAWAKMSRMKASAELRGNAYFMDNDRAWKIATGDVTWWRGEVNARANSIMALIQLATLMGLDLGPKWAEATTFGDVANGMRSFIRADVTPAPGAGATVRERVLGWAGETAPSRQLVSAARAWMTANLATPQHQGQMLRDDWRACCRLLKAAGEDT